MPADAPPRPSGGNLTLALVAVAFAELAVNRVGARMFFAHGSHAGGALGTVLGGFAPFLFHLVGLLGLFVLLGGAIGAARRRELFLPAMRLTLAVIGVVFVVIAFLGLVSGVSPRLLQWLQTSHGFLSIIVVAAAMGADVPGRVRAGLVVLVIPAVLSVAASFIDRGGWFGDGGERAGDLARLAQVAAALAAATAGVLLPPRVLGPRPLLPAVLGAVLAAAAVVALSAWDIDLVQAAALYGFHVDLPVLGPWSRLLPPAGAAALTFASTQLLRVPGGSRLGGYGLLLLALGGPQPAAPHEVVLSLCGLVALAVGLGRAHAEPGRTPVPIADADWRAFVGRLAAALGDNGAGGSGERPPAEAVMVDDDDGEVARIRTFRAGHPVSVRARRRRRAVTDVEIVVGEPGHGEPGATVALRMVRLGPIAPPRIAAERTATGDPEFDARFVVHGTPPLGDEGLRLRLLQHLSGSVSLWPGHGARYRTLPARTAPADHPFGGAALDPTVTVDLTDTLLRLAGLGDGGTGEPQVG